MKIINTTNGTLSYIVTPSGTILQDSEIIASGTIKSLASAEFNASGVVTVGNVYLKMDNTSTAGYAMKHGVSPNSTITVQIIEG